MRPGLPGAAERHFTGALAAVVGDVELSLYVDAETDCAPLPGGLPDVPSGVTQHDHAVVGDSMSGLRTFAMIEQCLLIAGL